MNQILFLILTLHVCKLFACDPNTLEKIAEGVANAVRKGWHPEFETYLSRDSRGEELAEKIARTKDPMLTAKVVGQFMHALKDSRDQPDPTKEERIEVFSLKRNERENPIEAIRARFARKQIAKDQQITEISIDQGKKIFGTQAIAEQFHFTQVLPSFIGDFRIEGDSLIPFQELVKRDPNAKALLVSLSRPSHLVGSLKVAKETTAHYPNPHVYRDSRLSKLTDDSPVFLNIMSESLPFYVEKLKRRGKVEARLETPERYLVYVGGNGTVVSLELGAGDLSVKKLPAQTLIDQHKKNPRYYHRWSHAGGVVLPVMTRIPASIPRPKQSADMREIVAATAKIFKPTAKIPKPTAVFKIEKKQEEFTEGVLRAYLTLRKDKFGIKDPVREITFNRGDILHKRVLPDRFYDQPIEKGDAKKFSLAQHMIFSPHSKTFLASYPSGKTLFFVDSEGFVMATQVE